MNNLLIEINVVKFCWLKLFFKLLVDWNGEGSCSFLEYSPIFWNFWVSILEMSNLLQKLLISRKLTKKIWASFLEMSNFSCKLLISRILAQNFQKMGEYSRNEQLPYQFQSPNEFLTRLREFLNIYSVFCNNNT